MHTAEFRGYTIKENTPIVLDLSTIMNDPENFDNPDTFDAERFINKENGIIYFEVDHRGSNHFSKNSVAQMHRNLGKWEMHDYIESVKWLRKQPFVYDVIKCRECQITY